MKQIPTTGLGIHSLTTSISSIIDTCTKKKKKNNRTSWVCHKLSSCQGLYLSAKLARILIGICDLYWEVTMILVLCKIVSINIVSILTESKEIEILLLLK